MKSLTVSFTALMLVVFVDQAFADDKALREQRQTAQKERQAQKNERNKLINEATRSFRELTRELKKEYQERLRDLDTEFKLTQVELKAERDAKIAAAEAEFQGKLMSLFTAGDQDESKTVESLQADARAYSEELFKLRKESAQAEQRERVANEKRKHALLDERDARAMDEAAALGLTRNYSPILAAPIGDGLTSREESWNKREQKEIERITQRNQRTVAEFVNGAKLRTWELANMDEDFQLVWQEKEELHAINSQMSFYNLFAMQAAQGGEVDQQEMMARVTELNKQTQLARIKYNKLRQKNAIKRREEKRKLQGR